MAGRSVAYGLVSAAALLALSAPLAPVFAQKAPPEQAQPEATESGGGKIEEVVVTATRRSELISKVPESISAFTTEKIDILGIKNFADVAKFTPGVTFDPDSNDISIRGISSDAGSGTTGIYIDDTPIQMRALGFGSNNTLPAVFDLDRVEVLRGPQGTLFGAGSEGGTVRYITPQPSLTDYSVYAKSELSTTQGGDPSEEMGVATGGPIVDDKLGFRVSAWIRHDGGWIDKVDDQTDNVTDPNTNFVNTYVLRGALAWQPTNGLTITPSVYYQNRDQNNADQFWTALSNPDNGDFETATPERMADRDHFALSSLKMDYDLGSVEIISNTSYFDRREIVNNYSGTLYNLSYFQQLVDRDHDPQYKDCTGGLCEQYSTLKHVDRPPLLLPTGLDLPGYGDDYISNAFITNRQKNFTQEVRVQSTDTDTRLTWIAGVFYAQNAQDSIEQINDPQLPELTQYLWGETMMKAWGEELLSNGDDYINDTVGHDWQIAGFANATYSITDKLKVQAGIRIARTHFDFRNFANGPQNFGFSSGDGKNNETPTTPMVGLTYQINDDDMAYATWSKGYRIGGANAPLPPSCGNISGNTSSYDSDTVTNYEVGSKDKLFDHRLSIDVSAYYLNWDNIQQNNYIPRCGIQYTSNLGKATSKGFDAQADWLILDDLELDGSVGYTDARYTATELSTQKSGTPYVVAGDTLPVSPWTASLGLQYSRDVYSRPSYIRVDYEFNSRNSSLTPEMDSRTTSFDSGLVPDPPTNLFNVRAGVTLNTVNLALFMNNMFNSQPILDLNHQDLHTLLYEASTERPRTVGVTATYRY